MLPEEYHKKADSGKPVDLLSILSRQFPADFAAIESQRNQPSEPSPASPARPAGDISHDEFVRRANEIIAQKTGRIPAQPSATSPAQRDLLAGRISSIIPAIQQKIEKIPAINTVIRVDPEMARIAYSAGLYPVYRAWLYLRANNPDGSGRVDRETISKIWKQAGIAASDRHIRRLIEQGQGFFWNTSKFQSSRLYLAGIERVASRLITGQTTDKPGGKNPDMLIDLTGDISQSIARVYAAWIARKSGKNGVTISRARLQDLWNVEVKSLLRWEKLAGIEKQSNYAQSNDTSIDKVPAHARLCLHRDNSYFASWRLPNTYLAKSAQHKAIGKAQKIRSAVNRRIEDLLQRGYDFQLAPLVESLYFDSEKKCQKHIKRIARKDGDIFKARYFLLGIRHGVRIHEKYDIQQNYQLTSLSQRAIWQERKDQQFLIARNSYAIALAD
jgi:hypothetical protein